MRRNQILVGDIFSKISEIESDSIDCVVTSPPYWGLRDYGVEGQIGLEPTLAEHIETVVRYCQEIHRVLKPEGTFWLNYGDCYATTPNGRSVTMTKAKGNDNRTFRDKPFSTIQGSLKPKDLCMVPARIAIALQDVGWWLRSEIVWAKPNPMPESVKDRPATSHEKIFLFSKSPRYFYDASIVRQGLAKSSIPRLSQNIKSQKGSKRAHAGEKSNGPMKAVPGKPMKTSRGLPPRHEKGEHHHTNIDQIWRGSRSLRNWEPEPAFDQPEVWEIATHPFKDAHFATFPPSLAERCILAGCPKGGVVLDPFGGSGTTGLVADRLQRQFILIELNPEYAKLASNRILNDAPLLNAAE